MIQYQSLWLIVLLACPLKSSRILEATHLGEDWCIEGRCYANPQGQMCIPFYPLVDEQEEMTKSFLSENVPTCYYKDGMMLHPQNMPLPTPSSTFTVASIHTPQDIQQDPSSQNKTNSTRRPKKPAISRERRVYDEKKGNVPDGKYQARLTCVTHKTLDPSSVALFKERTVCGTGTPKDQLYYIGGDNFALGYRVSSSRIVFIDGYKCKGARKREKYGAWDQPQFDQTNLTKEALQTHYPLTEHGLAVFMDDSKKEILFWASGEPHKRAILLRQFQEKLVIKAISSSGHLVALPIEDGDMVVVAPYSAADRIMSGKVELKLSEDTENLARQICDLSKDRFKLCIVAKVSKTVGVM
jgi:hypothetical protein